MRSQCQQPKAFCPLLPSFAPTISKYVFRSTSGAFLAKPDDYVKPKVV
jgi:hypothetical protein